MSGDTLGIVIALLFTALMVVLTAIYVFHEFAIVTIRPRDTARIDQDQRSRISRLVSKSVHNVDHYIAVDQLGITVAGIAAGWVGQPVIADLLRGPFQSVGIVSDGVASVVAATIAFTITTGTLMVAGELMPKTIALRHPVKVARSVGVVVEATAWVFHPVVWALNGIGFGIVRMLGIKTTGASHGYVLPPEELAAVIQSSVRAGSLNVDPGRLLRALRFSDIQARDVLTPRHRVVGIDASASLDDVFQTIREHRLTRYPVYRESLDNVVGLLNTKDLIRFRGAAQAGATRDWRVLVQPMSSVPETALLEQAITLLRQRYQQMLLVVDEFGGVTGVVTVGDIVGRLLEDPETLQHEETGEFLVSGQTTIVTIEDQIGMTIAPDERFYETLGGLVIEMLGRIPVAGDRIVAEGVEIEVVNMDGLRIDQVRLRLPSTVAETEESGIGNRDSGVGDN